MPFIRCTVQPPRWFRRLVHHLVRNGLGHYSFWLTDNTVIHRKKKMRLWQRMKTYLLPVEYLSNRLVHWCNSSLLPYRTAPSFSITFFLTVTKIRLPKRSAPYWSNPPFLIFWHSDALALSPERQSARMSKNLKWSVRPVWRWTLWCVTMWHTRLERVRS